MFLISKKSKVALLIVVFLSLSIQVVSSSNVTSNEMLFLIATKIFQRINPNLQVPDNQITTSSQNEANENNQKDTPITKNEPHTVIKGDTLWSIAHKYHTTVEVIKSLNKLNSEALQIGQKIEIPQIDKDLLARLVHSEAEGEPFEGQVAVAAVVLNRIKDSRFPDSLEDVVYEKNAFEVVANSRIELPAGSTAIKAVEEALKGSDPSNGSVFFYNPDKLTRWNWVQSRTTVCRIGNHLFAK